ncbi:hypothetical protein EPUS_02716 [Endocarpon pusillum Z07020]|uniref:Uncharacterized protein n=1 Tax=Endocarpon pusillum (strain Z07020 / HMAS-L-300199) TaxID=1263415 RepID=U1HE00_ENDPU|nr:uncharacterized protein EPUS_02716 [Endocarpon pusillum Z07020]ERF68260.1 hypothetical protein EPUS_02716 [Endocarpon pusillum Z07020]
MGSRIVFARREDIHPCRQPRNAPAGLRAQSDEGFARFLKQHASPTHQRVTAGGRIVPMESSSAPPQFNLFSDNKARDKDNMSHCETTDDSKIGNECPISAMSGTATTYVTTNTGIPSAGLGENPPAASSTKQKIGNASQPIHVNTNGDLKREDLMPRQSDLTHLAPASLIGMPLAVTNDTASFNPTSQALTNDSWESLALPSSAMIFNPYTNMLVHSGEQHPTMVSDFMPTSTMSTAPFPSVSVADQTSQPINHGYQPPFFSQQGLQPGLSASYNPVMPLSSTSNNPFPYAVSAPFHSGMANIAPARGTLAAEIGTHAQADYQAHMPAMERWFSNMTMAQPMSGTTSNTASQVTDQIVAAAKAEFDQLSARLNHIDQQTALHYSTFNSQIKGIYRKQRIRTVEEREAARIKWKQLCDQLEQERSVAQYLPSPADHQPTSSMNQMTSASTRQNGNTNFNVRASAWVPKENQAKGVHTQTQRPSALPNVSQPALTNNGATGRFQAGFGNQSFATRINQPQPHSLSNEHNMQLVVSNPSNAMPGPSSNQLTNSIAGEMYNRKCNNWGHGRGSTVDEVAENEHESLTQLRAQTIYPWCEGIKAAPRPVAANTAVSASPERSHPIAAWSSNLEPSPPGTVEKQSQQDLKLAKTHPDLRSEVSFRTFDSTLPTKANAGKTVSFADNDLANSASRSGYGRNGDASSALSSDVTESGRQPMMSGEAAGPSPRDWEAILEASAKEQGVKTEIVVADGRSITIEGTGGRDGPANGTNLVEQGDGGRQYQSVMSEQDRYGMGTQLMGMGRGVRGVEGTTTKPGSFGLNPWAPRNENNFFRHKGPSSVAVQSVTANGTMPGFDEGMDRYGQTALQPRPKNALQANDSPSRFGSPPPRSLKSIWEPTEAEQQVAEMRKSMYKF